MRKAWVFAGAAIGVAFALAPVERGRAAGGPLDGIWSVQVDCPSVGDVEGYNWRFPAEVSSGFISGLYRSATNSAIGHITGHIRPDGGALLMMAGRTGPEQFAIGRECRSIIWSTPISTDRAGPARETNGAPAR